VIDRELEAGIGGEQFVDLAQALGHALELAVDNRARAVLVIHVEIQRQQVHRNRIGKSGQQVLMLGLLASGPLW